MGANSKIADYTFAPWRMRDGQYIVASESTWRKPARWNRGAADGRHRPRVLLTYDVFEDWAGPMHAANGERLYFPNNSWEDRRPWIPISDCGGDEKTITMQDVRRRLFALIDTTPHLDWLLLTKRPENIARMMPSYLPRTAASSELDEVRLPIPGSRDYEVSNLGIVYTLRGSSICCFCGLDNPEGNKQKRYCSAKCRQASHYQRSKGVADGFEREAKPLAGDIGEDGHTRVTIYRDGVSERILVHRLVLTVFCRDPQGDEQGRHLDGNPRNNRIDNLAWGTQSANWDDSKQHGTHQRSNKLTVDQVAEIRSLARDGESKASLGAKFDVSATQIANILSGKHWKTQAVAIRPNVFLGVSVENRSVLQRIDTLRSTPAAARFLSVEPLLEDLGTLDLTGIHWVIVGGESGPGARPMHPDWARSLRDQCQASGVPFHFKQHGEYRMIEGAHYHEPALPNGTGGWQSAMEKIGKKAAGRLLDGREWSEFPAVEDAR